MTFCNYTYAELSAMNPNNVSVVYLVRYCTNGLYIRHLLAAGYRFPVDQNITQYVKNARCLICTC